ncbi:hypothetical protein BaRGS_00037387 [Batillaria attramentaria]|uniref:Uncharacterized protein n=1 Tax=Batillaria attramentaria TaxID=370345 RepID=A0ABD0J916_9CAEN
MKGDEFFFIKSERLSSPAATQIGHRWIGSRGDPLSFPAARMSACLSDSVLKDSPGSYCLPGSGLRVFVARTVLANCCSVLKKVCRQFTRPGNPQVQLVGASIAVTLRPGQAARSQWRLPQATHRPVPAKLKLSEAKSQAPKLCCSLTLPRSGMGATEGEKIIIKTCGRRASDLRH